MLKGANAFYVDVSITRPTCSATLSAVPAVQREELLSTVRVERAKHKKYDAIAVARSAHSCDSRFVHTVYCISSSQPIFPTSLCSHSSSLPAIAAPGTLGHDTHADIQQLPPSQLFLLSLQRKRDYFQM
jgi:hypothetical protein